MLPFWDPYLSLYARALLKALRLQMKEGELESARHDEEDQGQGKGRDSKKGKMGKDKDSNEAKMENGDSNKEKMEGYYRDSKQRWKGTGSKEDGEG